MLRGVLGFALLVAACGDDEGPADASSDTGSGARDSGAADAASDTSTDTSEDANLDSMTPDGGVCVPPGDCNPFVADACPADQVCVRRDTGRTECRAATDTADIGEPCARMEDCLPGSMCVNVDGESSCVRTCPGGSVGMCPSEERCSGSIGDDCVLFCRMRPLACDIYAQDCADPDDACTFATDPETDDRYTGCRPAGPNGLGETCGSDEGFCEEGLVCIRREGVSTCHEVCDAESPSVMCSDSAETCSGLSTGWMVTYCRPPPAG